MNEPIELAAGEVKCPDCGKKFTPPKANASARETELSAQVEQLTAANAEMKASIATAQEAKRAGDIATLAKDLGREFTADEVTTYKKLPDEAFAFVAGQMRATKPAAAKSADPTLFRAHATRESAAANGEGGAPTDVEDIRTRARKYVAEQKAAGIDVTIADAVTFVTRKAA